MKILAIIPASAMRHKMTGKLISIYSALPFGEAEEWETVSNGYTTANDNGTVGLGQRAFRTRDQAERYMTAYNAMNWIACRLIRLEG